MTIKKKLYRIIFESDTKLGKWFDIILIISIIASVLVVMLESIREIENNYGTQLTIIEWFFTSLFSIELVTRLYCSKNKIKYITSFFGIIDFISVIPTYIGLFIPGTHMLTVIRVLRVLRVFRILKLVQFINEAKDLIKSIRRSAYKIIVFILTMVTITIILGAIIYLIEGEKNGYTSIPRSIYWAIVTLTTVGYGDISPKTNLGQIFSGIIMILGYSIIIVSTGFIGMEINTINTVCSQCKKEIKSKKITQSLNEKEN